MTPETYAFLKDFAGPISTLIAASTAAVITFVFNRSQTRITRSQRDIALDRLKFDLFEKRYTIYMAAKSLLEYIALHATGHGKYNAQQIRSFYVTLEEARFYFPSEQQTILTDLHSASETYLNHLEQRGLINIDHADKWSAMAEQLAKDLKVLRDIYATLPEKFESALAFKQLTNPQ